MGEQTQDGLSAEVDRLLTETGLTHDNIPTILHWHEQNPAAPTTDSVKGMEASAQACERMWADIDAMDDHVAVLHARAAEYGCGCAEPAARLVAAFNDLREKVEGNREITQVIADAETNYRDTDLALQETALGRPVRKLGHTLSVFIGAVYDDLERAGVTGKQERCEFTSQIAFLFFPDHPNHRNGRLTWQATLGRINNPPKQ